MLVHRGCSPHHTRSGTWTRSERKGESVRERTWKIINKIRPDMADRSRSATGPIASEGMRYCTYPSVVRKPRLLYRDTMSPNLTGPSIFVARGTGTDTPPLVVVALCGAGGSSFIALLLVDTIAIGSYELARCGKNL